MTAKLLVLYRHPSDPAAFDAYYRDRHIGIAKRIPGLRSYEVSASPPNGLGGKAPYHLVATLAFDSMNALNAALASPEGAAAAADVPNFASGGAEMLAFETKDV